VGHWPAAAPVTLTDTVLVADPPGPVQVTAMLMVPAVVYGPTFLLPLVPPWLHEVALVLLHVSLAVALRATDVGATLALTVGAALTGALATDTVTDFDVEPPALLQLKVCVLVAVGVTTRLPLTGQLLPSYVHAVALVEDHVRVVL